MSENNVYELYGSMVFNDEAMRRRLPKEVYKSLTRTIATGKTIDASIADAVANAMKDWAIEKGATHYTHWFQPLTGVTAEKHDAFIAPLQGDKVVMEFSGKELIKGEPDASSFPSGGLRATFEARGYTAWDPASYAFVKGNTLYIPTAFCSYTGEALDTKTPLLRSMDALSEQALRILRLFGDTDTARVTPTVGAEQEYFLVNKDYFNRRKDLVYCGRTLFGAPAPKGQEMDDHYFGPLKPKVAAFMAELDDALWRLGINAKTEHNEVAPSQHELAPIYTTTNIATDHNQLTMEIMQKVAARHGLVCLLHEKPFDGVNGSGKHNNWSMATDTGVNLLTPGETPHENAQFLLFLCAVIQAVDDYQDLLRISVATAGNDHRLGANEAPPAVVSIFLGDELTAILDAIEKDEPYSGTEKTVMKLGAHVLPKFLRDTTDRNRTSPFAFTGNKFEFRMLGSANSIACCNIMLNAAVAESLRQYADKLEKAKDFDAALHSLIRQTIKDHKRIIFNGNGYDDAWIKEATEVRGLLNLRTTPDAMPYLLHEKNVKMLTSLKVMSEAEIRSRYEITLDNYRKIVNIEAETMVDMARRQILPAVEKFSSKLAQDIAVKKSIAPVVSGIYETTLVTRLSDLVEGIDAAVEDLAAALATFHKIDDVTESANMVRDVLLPKMAALRAPCDEAEQRTAEGCWPFPTYGDLLFGVE